MEIRFAYCECKNPDFYRDFSTITAHGAVVCRKCKKFAKVQLQ